MEEKITKPLVSVENPMRTILGVVIAALILGTLTGYILSTKNSGSQVASILPGKAKTAQQDTRTFKDFAEGVIKARPIAKDPTAYVEGTHYLQREGAVPVALTSSVVDLSLYEGKKVKVLGETQKALKEGWLMDVGQVEEVK
ncbi:hypothetical protein A3J19_04420 [Candidatus Daviesbacteria bacterium RIFCSPLOWO2_02_FULL_41_8]|uniref:Uncharacterized protein n=2 Tax=Candidatus Daviesiibacteriota TaxID=1752718 RepID=A0A1F5NIV0_9BACT|nr:MAG: hypothetical protein A3D83_00895 [Candidatus Daviesbacteria bacterium RIFCSPHIGHO2_02_FULL_41_10]OGE77599.1 MAG: hypothetical protein A3J19_04420 [Candidatus Daviesbacteria bacterium RIFCSPLOWO2_02_FULL_41_8]